MLFSQRSGSSPIVLLILLVLVAAGQVARSTSAALPKPPAKPEPRKGMSVREVQKHWPDLRLDVRLTHVSVVDALLVWTKGREAKYQLLNVYSYALAMPEIRKRQQANIARIQRGMSKQEVVKILGEPDKKGGMGPPEQRTDLWHYARWVLFFKGGRLTRETNRPKDSSFTALDIQEGLEALDSDLRDAKYEYGAALRILPDDVQHGALWRTNETIFLFWAGKLSQWGVPADNLADEFNDSLDMRLKVPYLPAPVPVRQIAIYAASTPKQRESIREGKVSVGMSHLMVRASWGLPRDINRTVIRGRLVSEQWCYGGIDGNYLYFEDGLLESWQD